MFRTHTLIVAALVATVGCSDSPTYAGPPDVGGPIPQEEISGTVEVEFSTSQPQIQLLQPSGERTILLGAEAYRLIALAGAEVRLRGSWVVAGPPLMDDLMTWQASVAFSVTEFVVLAVAGRPALDGVLVEVDGHFALHLSDGSIHEFDEQLGDLSILGNLVGSRIWVTGSMDDPPFTYGIIA